jgi:alpha-ketoglutarate-dependent taurine dioxygenase
VMPAGPFHLPVEDFTRVTAGDRQSLIHERVLTEFRRPFDLTRELPFRAVLLRTAAQEHVLVMVIHHIAFDRWSRGILFHELAVLYSAYSRGAISPLAEPSLQYRDFAQWQREWVEGPALRAQLSYWQEQLKGVPERLELPCDRPRPAFASHVGDYCSLPLSADLIQGLEVLARSERASLTMALVAGLQAQLSAQTGQTDVSLGLEMAGRTRLEFEQLVGCCTNTLVLRTNLSGDPTFRELLGRVRTVTFGAYTHQELPFEKLVEELRPTRNPAHHPFYQVLFNYKLSPRPKAETPGVQVVDFEINRHIALVDLSVDVERTEEGTTCYFNYNVDLFDRPRIARIVEDYRAFLEAVVAAPERPLSTLTPRRSRPDISETESLLSQLEQMSEEEAQRALDAESSSVGGGWPQDAPRNQSTRPDTDLQTPGTHEGNSMSSPDDQRPALKKPRLATRKGISVSEQALVSVESLQAETPLPVVVTPIEEGLDLERWAGANRDLLKRHLLTTGGILFRNFRLTTESELEGFIQAVSGEPLEYTYRSTPRKRVAGKVYTSTEYPSDQFIPLHNEMSYTRNWPMKIWFLCLKAAQEGGETPVADSRKVYRRIEPGIRDRFAEKRVMYVRTYGGGLDLPWQEVFQTTDKHTVEDYCRTAGIDFTWVGDHGLRTSQVCQAVATHPETGEAVWFNQAHLFHVSSLPPTVRDSLLSSYGEENLPRNVYYGDGTRIELSVLDSIREAYRQETTAFPWQEGDVLMLDNMLAAHGRTPFVGARKVVVGMAEAFGSQGS